MCVQSKQTHWQGQGGNKVNNIFGYYNIFYIYNIVYYNLCLSQNINYNKKRKYRSRTSLYGVETMMAYIVETMMAYMESNQLIWSRDHDGL